jgi:hypothetical protein
MTSEEIIRKREERRKNRKPGLAVVTGGCVAVFDGDTEWPAPQYYLQFSTTMGLNRDFGHPNIESLISTSSEAGGASIVYALARRVRSGERFSVGDRVELTFDGWGMSRCTVELRESANNYGPCLRAVVIGVEEELQNMEYADAEEHIASRGPIIDPWEGY